jgi:sulfite exporter TauE/SafE
MDFGAIFFLGLTTGGLTCLAVQGGLLATAMTRQVVVAEAPLRGSGRKISRRPQSNLIGIQLPKDPWPVVVFLLAKLVAYTGLGALLGLLGSVVQLNSAVQGGIQILVGVFMIGTALNMLNAHPVFRYFAIQPPRIFTRFIRNQARSADVFAPAILGALTVFIPCGTTQAIELLAITTGNPLLGALALGVFVLGTSPTFFVLGFAASQLRGKVQQVFAIVATTLILALGLVSINGGLNVLGSPYAPSRLVTSMLESIESSAQRAATPPKIVNGVQEITIDVRDTAYVPNRFQVESGKPIRLWLVTNNTYGCTRAFTIPRLGVRQILPETGRTLINLPALSPGDVFFTCSMGMYTGVIRVN